MCNIYICYVYKNFFKVFFGWLKGGLKFYIIINKDNFGGCLFCILSIMK